MRRRLHYLPFWYVDPNSKEQDELFFRLKNFLLLAASYLDIKHEANLFLSKRMPMLKALEILTEDLRLKAAFWHEGEQEGNRSNLPLLARRNQYLILLLPYDNQKYQVIDPQNKNQEYVFRDVVGTKFAEIIELYPADAPIDILDTRSLNRQITSFLPAFLIFSSSVLKIFLLGVSISSLAFLFNEQARTNSLALILISLTSLFGIIILDYFCAKSANKNKQVVTLWVLGILFKRIFFLDLSHYIHTVFSQVFILRDALASSISRYFSLTPKVMSAWALVIINIIVFLNIKLWLAIILVIFAFIAVLFSYLINKYEALFAKEDTKAHLKLDQILASIEASFSMALSLGALDDIVRVLTKNAFALAKTRETHERFLTYIKHTKWFLPLLFVTLAVCIQLSTNVLVTFLWMVDALLIGRALALILYSKRPKSPVIKNTVDDLKSLHQSKHHRILPVNIEGNVELNNISFSYPDTGLVLFKNLNLNLKAGQFLGITGPSGSGKSTLLRLFMGQEEPEVGQVIYDGQDLRSLKLDALRQHFGYVGQTSGLFAGSVIDNIVCGRKLPERALKNLIYSHSIFESLLDLPMGLETYVFQKGTSLSRVQAVVLLLMRALIHKPKILFMDEILKGLSFDEQQLLKEYLKSLTISRILVSHHSLDDLGCDKLYVPNASS